MSTTPEDADSSEVIEPSREDSVEVMETDDFVPGEAGFSITFNGDVYDIFTHVEARHEDQ